MIDAVVGRLLGLKLDTPYRVLGSLCGVAVAYDWLCKGARLPSDAVLKVARALGLNLDHAVSAAAGWIDQRPALAAVGLVGFCLAVAVTFGMQEEAGGPFVLRSAPTVFIALALYVQSSGSQPNYLAVALAVLALVGRLAFAWHEGEMDADLSALLDLALALLFVPLVLVGWPLFMDGPARPAAADQDKDQAGGGTAAG